jgi:hypothetical protein
MDWLTTVGDVFWTILGGLAITLGTWLGAVVKQYFNAKQIQTLQTIFNTALENAAGASLNLLDPETVVKNGIDLKNPDDAAAVQKGVAYLKSATPDSVKLFGLSDDDIASKIIAMINKLLVIGGSFGIIPPKIVDAVDKVETAVGAVVDATKKSK